MIVWCICNECPHPPCREAIETQHKIANFHGLFKPVPVFPASLSTNSLWLFQDQMHSYMYKHTTSHTPIHAFSHPPSEPPLRNVTAMKTICPLSKQHPSYMCTSPPESPTLTSQPQPSMPIAHLLTAQNAHSIPLHKHGHPICPMKSPLCYAIQANTFLHCLGCWACVV